jgi:hypothetical protein
LLNRITDIINSPDQRSRNLLVFFTYWFTVFVLYLPAATAGRVGDFPGWVDFLNSVNFWDYINRSNSGIPSMYQFTQVVTYFFYLGFKGNAWPWHLLNITLQAANALLVFMFFARLFKDSTIKNDLLIAFSGALLFSVCPHISEVVVWEPAFHYLFALLLMLIVLLCTQSYLNTQKTNYLWWGGIVFFLSTFSLEIFYLTPLFVGTLAIYKYSTDQCDKATFRKTLLNVLLPQAIMFAINQILVHAIYHQGVAHIGFVSLLFSVSNFSKALKYLFHIMFMGRYFSQEARNNAYHLFESKALLIAFYGTASIILTYIAARFRTMTTGGKTTSMLFLWLLFAIGLVAPLSFPDTGLSILDRYTYLIDALIFVFVALLFNAILNRTVLITVLVIYGLINVRFTHRINAYWQQSAAIVNNLVYTFPNDPTKKVLLLDLPECLQGVQMVGSRDDGEFRMMYNAIMPSKLTNTVHDVEAFFVSSPVDGVHVMVRNDSTVHITLNQWGTWWLYYGFGAKDYENSDYKVNMRDSGHWYELILKHPASEYLLLYQTAGNWKKVDMAKIDVDQY